MKTLILATLLPFFLTAEAEFICHRTSECTENVSPGVSVQTCTRPVNGATAAECGTRLANGQRVDFIADERHAGYFWRCIRIGRFSLIPCQCPLGTRVSSLFFMGQTNPCSKNLNVHNFLKFDYTRKDLDLAPCVQTPEFTCLNGGAYTNLNEKCWCVCPAQFTGHRCEKPATPAEPLPPHEPCSANLRKNYCEGNPCLNGGRCENQCGNFFCHCVGRFTAGRRCEKYNCTEDSECLNGGTCYRGPDESRAWAECDCAAGTTGAMCEIILGS